MKNVLLNILDSYLEVYPEEAQRQEKLIEFLKEQNDESITDWNNFDGHIVAGGFIYAKEEKKFLVLYHKDLKMYLYPGGHVDSNDDNVLSAARREVFEETGFNKLENLYVTDDENVPIDIDTHMIGFNERLQLPEHCHFDFRYLFVIEKVDDVIIDSDEHSEYQWIDMGQLVNDSNYGRITLKLQNVLEGTNKLMK